MDIKIAARGSRHARRETLYLGIDIAAGGSRWVAMTEGEARVRRETEQSG
jgi:hypothetical protein